MKIVESISKKELLEFIKHRILELTAETTYSDNEHEQNFGARCELEKLESYLLKNKVDE